MPFNWNEMHLQSCCPILFESSDSSSINSRSAPIWVRLQKGVHWQNKHAMLAERYHYCCWKQHYEANCDGAQCWSIWRHTSRRRRTNCSLRFLLHIYWRIDGLIQAASHSGQWGNFTPCARYCQVWLLATVERTRGISLSSLHRGAGEHCFELLLQRCGPKNPRHPAWSTPCLSRIALSSSFSHHGCLQPTHGPKNTRRMYEWFWTLVCDHSRLVSLWS